jgi:hypothetical protein
MNNTKTVADAARAALIQRLRRAAPRHRISMAATRDGQQRKRPRPFRQVTRRKRALKGNKRMLKRARHAAQTKSCVPSRPAKPQPVMLYESETNRTVTQAENDR